MILLKIICIYLLIGSLIELWGANRTAYKYKLTTYILVMFVWPFVLIIIFVVRWRIRKVNENLTRLLRLIKEKDTVALQKRNDSIIKKEN